MSVKRESVHSSFFHFSFQQKAREEREAKRAMIDFRHEYLISTVATTLGLTNEEVTESLLEGSQVCITSL